MEHPSAIRIEDYTYDLPNERIALKPISKRDASKLLIYRNGNIETDQYQNIAQHLPENCLLVFNNTKVIPARLRYKKPTGSTIEIFCLEPANAAEGYHQALNAKHTSQWLCLVGGISKWKEDYLSFEIPFMDHSFTLKASLDQKGKTPVVQFDWEEPISFVEVLHHVGKIPLPPYIKREDDEEDVNRYQTTYAVHEGSVAAPTAGLHFTPQVIESLNASNINHLYLTLHVGAGTFKPVTAERLEQHEMHGEWIDVDLKTLDQLQQNKNRIAVGTTSLRTLETLYWLGVKCSLNISNPLSLSQWEVYESHLVDVTISYEEAIEHLKTYLMANKMSSLYMQTHILIAPGYKIRSTVGIVTNFHQPQSTLLLLVAAGVGSDWKSIYQYALDNDFRFLSYGDGSLLYWS